MTALPVVDLPHPGLADEAERLALADVDRHPGDGVDLLAAGGELDDEVLDPEQRLGRRAEVRRCRCRPSVGSWSLQAGGGAPAARRPLPPGAGPIRPGTSSGTRARARSRPAAVPRRGTRPGRRGSVGEPAAARRVHELRWTAGMACSRAWRGSSSLGIECSSASVYGMRTLRNSVAVGAFSTIWPAYITAMSSARPATTPRSWVTRIIAMFRSRCWRASRFRICACTVTSRAVVGSSANSSLGPQASATAIITRWRMPPDSSCGYCDRRCSGSGMPTDRSRAMAFCFARPAVDVRGGGAGPR